jgi:glyoxylase-like metal-dependent hydrolase (beta-lactamase superfamily II)
MNVHTSSHMGVHTIDLELMGLAGTVAAHFIPSKLGHIIVDCGPTSTLPKLKAGIAALGYDFADVKYLLLTHIHLDHAGATGTLAREFPNLHVYVHQHGAGHLKRPERLLESATRIYGAMMQPLWGQFEAVPEDQLVVLEGRETLNIGEFSVQAVYTPGHAIHHLAFAFGNTVFCGDVGGIRLKGAEHVIAPTPPPDIDFVAWHESLAKLRALQPNRLFLTHFGEFNDVEHHLAKLEHSLVFLENMSKQIFAVGGSTEEIAEGIKQYAQTQIQDKDLEKKYELSTPYLMAASGLMRYQKQRAA